MKTIKQLKEEIERIVRESKYKMGMSHIDGRKIKELEAQISQSKSTCEMIEECLDTLNSRIYSDNLKEHFEFGRGILEKILTKIKGDEK